MNWQTYTAAAIVLVTLAIFIIRIARPGGESSCGKGCGCGKKPGPKEG